MRERRKHTHKNDRLVQRSFRKDHEPIGVQRAEEASHLLVWLFSASWYWYVSLTILQSKWWTSCPDPTSGMHYRSPLNTTKNESTKTHYSNKLILKFQNDFASWLVQILEFNRFFKVLKLRPVVRASSRATRAAQRNSAHLAGYLARLGWSRLAANLG